LIIDDVFWDGGMVGWWDKTYSRRDDAVVIRAANCSNVSVLIDKKK
jgi:hypothetical protein